MRLRRVAPVALIAAGALLASGCGSSDTPGEESNVVTVAYNVNGDFPEPKATLADAKEGFEAANPGITVELQPQTAPDDQFHTKIALALKAGNDVPDVIYYREQFVDGDAAAGYLAPLDDSLERWPDWELFSDATKSALKGADGRTYVVPFAANTIAIWYNKDVLADAGISMPWQPQSWDDLLETARAIKSSEPDAIPVHLYVGKASGTSDSTIKTFRPLLHGTGKSLFADGKWQAADDDFIAAWSMMRQFYEEDLTAPTTDVLSPNVWSNIGPWFKDGKLGFTIDGNWMSYNWVEGGPSEWPAWGDKLGVVAMPSRDSADPATVGLPGPGLALAADSDAPDLAAEFIEFATNMENSKTYGMNSGQLAVRSDVAEDPEYAARPTIEEFTAALDDAFYVPVSETAGRVESVLSEINEQVALGSMTPEEAASSYNDQVPSIVGEDNFAS